MIRLRLIAGAALLGLTACQTPQPEPVPAPPPPPPVVSNEEPAPQARPTTPVQGATLPPAAAR